MVVCPSHIIASRLRKVVIWMKRLYRIFISKRYSWMSIPNDLRCTCEGSIALQELRYVLLDYQILRSIWQVAHFELMIMSKTRSCRDFFLLPFGQIDKGQSAAWVEGFQRTRSESRWGSKSGDRIPRIHGAMFSSALEILQMVYEREIISQLLDELMEINELDVRRGGVARVKINELEVG